MFSSAVDSRGLRASATATVWIKGPRGGPPDPRHGGPGWGAQGSSDLGVVGPWLALVAELLARQQSQRQTGSVRSFPRNFDSSYRGIHQQDRAGVGGRGSERPVLPSAAAAWSSPCYRVLSVLSFSGPLGCSPA